MSTEWRRLLRIMREGLCPNWICSNWMSGESDFEIRFSIGEFRVTPSLRMGTSRTKFTYLLLYCLMFQFYSVRIIIVGCLGLYFTGKISQSLVENGGRLLDRVHRSQLQLNPFDHSALGTTMVLWFGLWITASLQVSPLVPGGLSSLESPTKINFCHLFLNVDDFFLNWLIKI